MENSPIDPTNYEADEDSDEEEEISPSKSILESLFKDAKENNEEEKPSLIDFLKDIDKNPELDSEAPVEELSEVEIQQISRDIAKERLEDVPSDEGLDAEDIASRTYLENVIETGDPDYAFIATAKELAIDQEVNPMDLLERADQEPITTENNGHIEEAQPSETNENTIFINQRQEGITSQNVNERSDLNQGRRRSISVPKVITSAALLDTLLYRRKARIEKQNKSEQALKAKLDTEVERLNNRINRQESYIKQKAKRFEEQPIQNRVEKLGAISVEKPELNIPEQPEKISKKEILELGKTLEKVADKNEEIIERPKSSVKLKRRELLLIASKVEVMGTNLRKIHENGQLSEKGLRRMIEVYLRGGNLKKALKRELLEKEIDFERDPAIRDQGILNDEYSIANESKIDDLLKQRGIAWDDGLDIKNIETRDESSNPPTNIMEPTKKPFKAIDLILVLLIIILLVIILLIFFKV